MKINHIIREKRKELYLKEAEKYFNGKTYVPNDLENIQL